MTGRSVVTKHFGATIVEMLFVLQMRPLMVQRLQHLQGSNDTRPPMRTRPPFRQDRPRRDHLCRQNRIGNRDRLFIGKGVLFRGGPLSKPSVGNGWGFILGLACSDIAPLLSGLLQRSASVSLA